MAKTFKQIMSENAPVAPAPHIHRVAVTVSDPDSSAVSKRKETVQKMIRITHHTDNKAEAVERAKKHYKKFGWKVHGAEHVGMVNEETQIQEADEIQTSDYKLSASGKKVRAKHIVFHSQDDDEKEDKKEDMKEETLVEAKVETKKYSWGTMKTVHHGADFSIPLHPEHHQAIAKLKDEQEHKFKDETGRHWTARRKGDDVHFQGANGGNSTKVKHSDLKEEKLSDDEMAERERIVKGMKKNLQSFKDKYGANAKSVMYATATKLAKEEKELEEAKYNHDDNRRGFGRREREDDEYHVPDPEMKKAKMKKQEVELQEANHREFASQGKMHPDMAKHMTVGNEMDFYAHGTGDKVSGKVIKNDGKTVHVKQTHDSYNPKKVGTVHKFAVSTKLDEGRMKDIATNAEEDKRLAALAKQKTVKEWMETLSSLTEDEQYEFFEAVQKVDIPAYLRKQKGEAPLTLKDLKRKDTISDKENLAKLRGVKEELKGNQHKLDKNKNGKLDKHDFKLLRKEDFENGEVETNVKSYKDFVQSLNEYNAKDGVYRHKGTYGGSHQETEDDDEDDKPKAKPQGEKRGRGRPKGSASGARQQGSASGKKTNGADYTGYKLHLPNKN